MPARNRKSKYLTHQLVTKRMAAADVDVYRSAGEMIKQFGTDAEAEALRMAAECRTGDDKDTAAVWVRIAKAIDGLIRTPDGPLN
jgi:hypothetical protein